MVTERAIRVLVADDHAVVREGTRHILNAEEDLEVVGEAADGEQAVQMAATLKPDVVLLDMTMPKMNGVEATQHIKAVSPATAVLILTAYDDDQYVFAVLEAGAAGYLLKTTASGPEIVGAIRAARRGESVLHPSVTRKVLQRLTTHQGISPPEKREELLTVREMEVLRAAASGASNKAIALDLGLSDRTIQAHLASVFAKLNVGSRIEAVTKALKEGLISIEDLE